MNILITRPLIDSEDLMGKLFSMGHKIVHIPTLKISAVKALSDIANVITAPQKASMLISKPRDLKMTGKP